MRGTYYVKFFQKKFTHIYCEFSNYISIALLEIGNKHGYSIFFTTESPWPDRFFIGKNDLFGIHKDLIINVSSTYNETSLIEARNWIKKIR